MPYCRARLGSPQYGEIPPRVYTRYIFPLVVAELPRQWGVDVYHVTFELKRAGRTKIPDCGQRSPVGQGRQRPQPSLKLGPAWLTSSLLIRSPKMIAPSRAWEPCQTTVKGYLLIVAAPVVHTASSGERVPPENYGFVASRPNLLIAATVQLGHGPQRTLKFDIVLARG